MKLDLSNKKKLIISTDRDNFLKAISYFSSLSNIKYEQVFHDLSRSITISDSDLELIIHFLLKFNFFQFNESSIEKQKDFSCDEVFKSFSHYYFQILQENKDINFNLFINSNYILDNDLIFINVNSIKLSYRPFFISLQKLGFLLKSKKKNFVVINNYQLAKKILERPLRKISQEEFEKELKQKRIRGVLAEEFVVAIENEKLKSQNLFAKRVSVDDVSLGYDVLSYTADNQEIYIEVKTLMYGDSFFWTKNEIKSSKSHASNYYIYCIQFDNKNNPLKIKKIIQNPYLNIFTKKIYKYESTGDYLITI